MENQQPQQTQAVAQPKQVTPLARFNNYIKSDSISNYLEKVLGNKKEAFVSNIVGLVGHSVMLQNCDPTSVMFSAIQATALDLPLDSNLGFAYVVPYNTREGNKAQFQIGYKGFVQLALRTNLYRTINVRDVRQGEITGEDFVSGEMTFKALPASERTQAPVIGYIAFIELTNGFRKMSYWTVEEIKTHAQKFSKTFNKGGVWATNFDAMAKKTVLKLLIGKYGPMSVDLQKAMTADQAVITAEGNRYIDNEPDTAVEVIDEPQPPMTDAEKVMAAAMAAESQQQ